MPNHIHEVVVIDKTERRGAFDASHTSFVGKLLDVSHLSSAGVALAAARLVTERKTTRNNFTLGDIIGSFKSKSINRYLKFLNQHNLNKTVKFW